MTYRVSCRYETTGVHGCNAAHNAYSTTVFAGSNKDDFVNIGPSWTCGLAIHPVGAPPFPPFPRSPRNPIMRLTARRGTQRRA